MPRTRRAAAVFVACEDVPVLEIDPLLRGEVVLELRPRARAFSVLAGEEADLSSAELGLLVSLPGDRWVDAPESSALAGLLSKGLAVREDDPEARRRDELLKQGEWNAYAALYHARGRWRDFALELEEEVPPALPERYVAEVGPPPAHFYSAPHARRVDLLPAPTSPGGELLEVLRARRTTRAYADSPLPLADLALVLDAVFGCRGYVEIASEYVSLRKTSPSGGALHPVEAYLLVQNVDGVEPGLYHYGVGEHTLELLEPLVRAEAADAAAVFTCGQTFARAAHVLVVLAARFRRSFWKYRENERAYAVVLMEAGHLSQTLYLVCARLGLGAFVTAAINAANIDERLGLDGFEQGALAICGFGVPATGGDAWLTPTFVPYDAVAARSDAL